MSSQLRISARVFFFEKGRNPASASKRCIRPLLIKRSSAVL
jgi:hypothetical protein